MANLVIVCQRGVKVNASVLALERISCVPIKCVVVVKPAYILRFWVPSWEDTEGQALALRPGKVL